MKRFFGNSTVMIATLAILLGAVLLPPKQKSPEILGSLEKGLSKTAGVQSPYIIGPSRLSRL